MERRQRPIGWSANIPSLEPILWVGPPWLESVTSGGDGHPAEKEARAASLLSKDGSGCVLPWRRAVSEEKCRCRQLSTSSHEVD
ncbi:hypothetical protein Sfum_0981 [Syntrophobacter fumaroxidans MPOB]|uniref:Uncharacterized protein n=1 Tax=Syntrophobacter fumaroxidans (strain DSM 10017 / MPOB) TaxID=335543 RepID=A0LGX5_SYNFM|nr:hypothetical protein Sfum_0981 [Syntrophobacter fumaroxidans MPOB]